MARQKFFVWSFVMALAVMSYASLAQAQDRGSRSRGRSWSDWRGSSSSLSGLLRSEEIRKHLDMSDAQFGKVSALRDGGDRPNYGELFRGLRDLDDEQRQAKLTEIRGKIQESRTAGEKKLLDILLPHQVDRLKQIALQSQMRRSGGIITAVSNALKLNDDQKAALQKAQQEGQEKLQAEINKLREELNSKILSTLTSSQRAQWKKLVGKQFTFPDRSSRGSSRSGR